MIQYDGEEYMKWSIGLKIGIMNLIAICILICINLASYYSINHMMEDAGMRQHSYQVIGRIERLLSVLIDAETGQRGYLITHNDRFLEPYNAALVAIPVEFKAIQSLTADNISQLNQLAILEPLITSKLANIQQSLKLTDLSQELASMDNGKKIMDDIRKIIYEMNNAEKELITQRDMNTKASANVTFNIIIYGTFFAVIFLILIGIIITRNIVNPIKEITNAAKKIKSGQLDNTFTSIKKNDEVGILAQAFSHMVTSLRQFTIDKQEGIKILNTSVNEISSSIRQLVTTGSETAAAVSETTSTIEEVRQASQVSSQKAKTVSENAQQTAQISQSGTKSTQETNEGMMRIRDQMILIAESMIRLSEQTQGINNIIETVDDLAQQSNLLAVNASIESERAGEQGKGFRIVAQEIKSLADQSKQATYRVREILSDVQKATSTAVLATEQGNKVAEEGIKKSEEAGESITKLSNSIMEAAQAAIQIAASSHQQLIGMEQVTTAMENIKEASAQNVENAKQLELATHNLKELGVKLQQSMSKYRVSTEPESVSL